MCIYRLGIRFVACMLFLCTALFSNDNLERLSSIWSDFDGNGRYALYFPKIKLIKNSSLMYLRYFRDDGEFVDYKLSEYKTNITFVADNASKWAFETDMPMPVSRYIFSKQGETDVLRDENPLGEGKSFLALSFALEESDFYTALEKWRGVCVKNENAIKFLGTPIKIIQSVSLLTTVAGIILLTHTLNNYDSLTESDAWRLPTAIPLTSTLFIAAAFIIGQPLKEKRIKKDFRLVAREIKGLLKQSVILSE